MLEVGIEYRLDGIVTGENTAAAMGSGDLPVFATPAMIALMEGCAARSAAAELGQGQTTVGAWIEVKHLRASPVGAKVWARSKLVEIEGRKLTFEVSAYDGQGLIGEGRHRRAVVDRDRFMKKCGE